jgi:hypothetical protein
MERKRQHESNLITPAAAPGGGVPVNGSTRIPQQNVYEASPVYDERPPPNKRSVFNGDEYSYYNNDYAAKADSWVPGYEREAHSSQFSAYPQPLMSNRSMEYDYSGYNQQPAPPAPKPNLAPKRKLTCELPWPTLPERAPNSKFGLGIDRYGHEQPSPLMDEFQDTVTEMENEIAFLKRHPEVATRIPHAVRILEKEHYKLDRCVDPEWLEVDINKPINLVRKILIPTNRHPGFNFIGKIIGNRGTTLHNLGKAFKCHINLGGEGSSRDRKKESQLFATNDERHMHYGLPLFVQISTIARPHVAFMRVAGFLNVLHKMLIPSHDIHIAGITDGNTWYESGETFVYEPILFDEDADEAKEAELRAGASGVAIRGKSHRGRGGARGSSNASSRGGRGGSVQSPSMAKEDDYVVCYDPDQFDTSKVKVDPHSNGMVTSRGASTARGASRGRGKSRGAIPLPLLRRE